MKLYALASLLVAGIVATTSYAPRWPTAALDYWIAADAILSDLSAEMAAAYDGADSGDTLANLQGLRESLAELDPPPAMLATHVQIAYALQSCALACQSMWQRIPTPCCFWIASAPSRMHARKRRATQRRWAGCLSAYPPDKRICDHFDNRPPVVCQNLFIGLPPSAMHCRLQFA